MENKLNLVELLDYIDPATLNYQEWLNVGFALKHEGYSIDDWDNWSRRDMARYHDGETEKKWEKFNGSAKPVTGATITQLAKENGWRPPSSDTTSFSWNDSFVASDIDRGYQVVNTDYILGEEVKEPKNWDPIKQITDYFETLFRADDIVGFVNDAYLSQHGDKEKWLPTQGVYTWTAGTIIEKLKQTKDIGAVLGDPNEQAGAWIRFNPLDGKGVKNENVIDFRYALIESDNMDVAKQNEILRKLELPIATLTYSGGKSLHAVVKVDAANYGEYQERVDYLYKIVEKNGLFIDKQNKNPSRLTRLPGFERAGKKQFLVARNIGQASWDEWKEYIEDMNDNLPEMENMADLFDEPIVLAPELIEGVLRQGHKMLIAGPSKAGKSFSLIQLAIAIAEGWEWFGFKCQQGKVLYVNLELDERSAKKRFADIYKELGRGHDNVGNIDVWNLRGKTSPMDKLAPKLIRRAQKSDYIAVIIDPIYKVLTGDENNAHDMSVFVNQFDMIATELQCSVIYAHHHSKGAQGGKSSIDRSSGSGVFARDPDAILDLIELPVNEDRYKQRENDAICNVYAGAIKTYNPTYSDIGQDDIFSKSEMGKHLMKAIQDPEKLKYINEQKDLAVTMVRQATAWRLEGTLREFPKFTPVNAWFKYPIHMLDESLQDINPEDDNSTQKWKKGTQKSNQSRAEKAQKELEEAFYSVNMEGNEAVEINAVADYLDLSKRSVYRRVENSDKFIAEDGMIRKK